MCDARALPRLTIRRNRQSEQTYSDTTVLYGSVKIVITFTDRYIRADCETYLKYTDAVFRFSKQNENEG